jgi:hypothetical protein
MPITYNISCDECQAVGIENATTRLIGARELRRQGWLVQITHEEVLCPTCVTGLTHYTLAEVRVTGNEQQVYVGWPGKLRYVMTLTTKVDGKTWVEENYPLIQMVHVIEGVGDRERYLLDHSDDEEV